MLLQRLFARKSLETLHEEMRSEDRLQRVLGPVALTALGVGAVIGAGIFVTTGRAAAQDAGPAVMVSYLVAGLGCALAALCYAEFASLAPVAGSAYTYAYATLGELLAWIIGWDLILEYAMSCATVAAAWSGYLNEFLAACNLPQVPVYLAYDPFAVGPDGVPLGAWFNLPAVLILAFCTAVLVIGIRESALTNATLVIVKLAVVVLVIALGAQYVDRANWWDVPIVAANPERHVAEKWGLLAHLGINEWLLPIDDAVRSRFAPFGVSGIMLGASIVFFAFIGFDSISTHSEEARQPQRDVPIAILVTLGLCTALYMGVAAVITGMVPYPQIDVAAPLAAAFSDKAAAEQSVWLRGATAIIAAGGLAGMTSVLLVTFLSQARIFLAMARDGLMPPVFGAVHDHYRTPHMATLLTGGVTCVVAAFTPIVELEAMVNIGTLLAFVIVCAAVLILRYQRPDAPRPFRCPLVQVVAPLGIVVNLTMMLFLPDETWWRLVIWLALGLGCYFAYGYWRSDLGQRLRENQAGSAR